jgi:hypothetical protein
VTAWPFFDANAVYSVSAIPASEIQQANWSSQTAWQVRVHPAVAARPDVLRDQFGQAGALHQCHHRHRASRRHQIRVIE